MFQTTRHQRVPRAGIDRIDDATIALGVIATAIALPRRDETILLLLDADRRGRAIVVVTGTDDHDAVVGVVECITRGAYAEQLGGIVLASVRTGPLGQADGRQDIDRWLEMSDVAEQVGVEVIEWFVIDRAVRCPRDDLGEAPRW